MVTSQPRYASEWNGGCIESGVRDSSDLERVVIDIVYGRGDT